MDEQKMNIVDYTFKLEELVDEMSKSVKNADEVIKQQQLLIDVVEASNDKDRFTDFLASLKTDIKAQLVRVEDAKHRLALIEELIKLCKDNETKAIAIVVCSMLFEGLGIMRTTAEQTTN